MLERNRPMPERDRPAPERNRSVSEKSPSFAPRCPLIQFHDVTLALDGFELIHNITCRLEPTGRTVVLGPNGAGKSLFLRLMGGLLTPSAGKITRRPTENGGTTAAISLVFQNPVMLRRSACENLAFVLHQQKIPAREARERIDRALDAARLGRVKDHPARRLSGGEQQRLAMARALITGPGALLLDEPTASLDPLSTSIVEEMVMEADRTGTKIVFVTHDIKQAKRMADDILFLYEGRVLVHKPARAFFDDPESQQAQAYLDGRVPI